MEYDFFPFSLHCLLLSVPNMHDLKRVTTSFKSLNIDGGTQNSASLYMELEWRLDNFKHNDLDSCCKDDNTSRNMIY